MKKKNKRSFTGWLKGKYKQVTRKENVEKLKKGLRVANKFTQGAAAGVDSALGYQPVKRKMSAKPKSYDLPELF